MSENILTEADRLTSRDRNEQYGDPLSDFSAQAQMWSAYLNKRYPELDGFALDHRDVAMMMVLTKVARMAQGYKRDTLTDIAGYARTAEMAHDREAELERELRAKFDHPDDGDPEFTVEYPKIDPDPINISRVLRQHPLCG